MVDISELSPEQKHALSELITLRDEVLKASKKYTHPGRNLSPFDYSQRTDWRTKVENFIDILRPDDLFDDDNSQLKFVNFTKVFPKAPNIICLNVLRMKFPFISETKPPLY